MCPWNEKFSQAITEPAYAARDFLAGRDARTLAREILGMDDAAYRAAFRGSAMTRAKLSALKRNAAVALGNVGTDEDSDVLVRALDEPESLAGEHAAAALRQIGARRSQSRASTNS